MSGHPDGTRQREQSERSVRNRDPRHHGRRAPARGRCEITRPLATVREKDRETAPTRQPWRLIARVAAATVFPFTLGTTHVLCICVTTARERRTPPAPVSPASTATSTTSTNRAGSLRTDPSLEQAGGLSSFERERRVWLIDVAARTLARAAASAMAPFAGGAKPRPAHPQSPRTYVWVRSRLLVQEHGSGSGSQMVVPRPLRRAAPQEPRDGEVEACSGRPQVLTRFG
jgi:hypothetical protein